MPETRGETILSRPPRCAAAVAYDPLSDPIVIAVVALAVGLGVLTFIEMKYVRKTMRGERVRRSQKARDLSDDAHNAVLTAKAVAASLRRAGVVTDEADSLLREADQAVARRNYQVAIDLADRAKGILKAEKARHTEFGDLARLEVLASGGEATATTKEQLARDHPPNFAAAKFSIGSAEAATAAAHIEGREVGAAERLLQQSKERFTAGDYAAALGLADHARKTAEGKEISAPAAPAPTPPAATAPPDGCPSCGTSVAEDDAFCRKCGAKLVA